MPLGQHPEHLDTWNKNRSTELLEIYRQSYHIPSLGLLPGQLFIFVVQKCVIFIFDYNDTTVHIWV